MRARIGTGWLAASMTLAFAATATVAGEAPLVALSSVDLSIHQDMRYAGARNFTGARVPGYQAAECWLRPAVARALAKVQADLAKEHPHLSLKVLDCYRPRRAVEAFMAWAQSPEDGRTKDYYPGLARNSLVPRGYIGRASTHARGIAVDLTLVERRRADTATGATHDAGGAADARSGGAQKGALQKGKAQNGIAPKGAGAAAIEEALPCTHSSDRARDPSALDMGTTFDCFHPRSHTHASGITREQAAARQILKRVMERHGFQNYPKEWWHYTYGAADDGRAFDVPITAGGRSAQ